MEKKQYGKLKIEKWKANGKLKMEDGKWKIDVFIENLGSQGCRLKLTATNTEPGLKN